MEDFLEFHNMAGNKYVKAKLPDFCILCKYDSANKTLGLCRVLPPKHHQTELESGIFFLPLPVACACASRNSFMHHSDSA